MNEFTSYPLLIDNLPVGYALHKLVMCEVTGSPSDYIFIEANKAFESLTGLERTRIIGQSVSAVLPGIRDGSFDWIGFYGRVALTGESAEFEQFSEPLGRWYKVNVYSPERLYFITLFTDITKEKSEFSELDRFFRITPELLCICDNQGWFVRVSDAWGEILGYSIAELETRNYLEFVHPDDIVSTREQMAKLENKEQILNFVNRYSCSDGAYRFLEWRSQPYGERVYAAARDITDSTLASKALSDASQFNQQVINSAASGIIVYDRDLRYQVWNPYMEELTGIKAQDVLGRHPTEVFPHLESVGRLELIKRALAGELLSVFDYNYWIPSKGFSGWSSDTVAPLKNSAGEITGVIATVRDVTERKMAEQALRDSEEKLRVTIMSVGDAFIATDKQGIVEMINPVAELLTGWTQAEAVGRTLGEVFNIINEYTREKCVDPVQKALETGQAVTLANHTILISKDGTERPIEDSAAPIIDAQGNIHGVVLVFRDFTDKKAQHDRIEYLSFHDALTGLYNRRFYEEEVKRLTTERNMPISVIMGDVNGLKLVNDAFGHDKGDELLQMAAQAIKKACRADDIVARWGGDEFIVLLPKTSREQAETVIKRIRALYAEQHVNAIQLSISFGCDTLESIDGDIIRVIKNAEDSMYRDKTLETQSVRGNIIRTIVHTLHEKNPREEQHSIRVSDIAVRIAAALGFSEEVQGKVRGVGLLHDIGKIAIDQSILNKPGSLTPQEWDDMKRHPEIGYRLLSSSHETQELGEYILAHHERWDGTGYPKGLNGDAIPVIARIIAIADAYDAMTSARAYKATLSEEQSIMEIRRNAGKQFDPCIAKVFIEQVLA